MSNDESVGSIGARCAYLILSHKNPAQVEDLADGSSSSAPTAHVVIHHDLKGGPAPWNGRSARSRPSRGPDNRRMGRLVDRRGHPADDPLCP